MALVELYRTTGARKYLEQAQYLVDNRGYGRVSQRPFGYFVPAYHQDHLPFRQLTRLEGHAVRAVYLNSGATDIAAEREEPELRSALDRMWASMTARQMYVHGGLGPRYENEGFGPADYELPNDRAHAETCASVANFMWNWRLLLLTAQARYADLMELELYNSVLSGVSWMAKAISTRPLSDDGHHRRESGFRPPCPGNVSRCFRSCRAISTARRTRRVGATLRQQHARLTLPDGSMVELIIGRNILVSAIKIETLTPGTYDLYLRLPGCADRMVGDGQRRSGCVCLDGWRLPALRREWHATILSRLNLPMPFALWKATPMLARIIIVSR